MNHFQVRMWNGGQQKSMRNGWTRKKEVLQSMIGEKAYTGGDGWFVWTQEKVDETIALYEDNLQK